MKLGPNIPPNMGSKDQHEPEGGLVSVVTVQRLISGAIYHGTCELQLTYLNTSVPESQGNKKKSLISLFHSF